MKKILFLISIFVLATFLTGSTTLAEDLPSQISNISCNLEESCSGDLECINFPEIRLRCAQSNPCSYYECPEYTECIIAESYPVQIICSPLAGAEKPGTTETVEKDITAEDLGIREPKTLPNSPFYFLKDFWRQLRLTFTFNSVKKADLRLQFANEMLIEAKRMAQETDNQELFQRAIDKYQRQVEKLRTRVEKFEEKAKDNPKIDAFLDRFTDKAIKQQVLIEELEEQLSHNPKAIEKIKEAKERVLENHSRVIEHLEEKTKIQERLEKNIQDIKEEKLAPVLMKKVEQAKEKIQERIKKIEEKGICITLWAPVCGKDGKTYGNTCFAERAGVEIAYKEKCRVVCKVDADCGPIQKCGMTWECHNSKCYQLSKECPRPEMEMNK